MPPFTKGNTAAAKKGTAPEAPIGEAVADFRAWIAAVAAAPAYRRELRDRMIAGKLSPGLEGQLLAFALGKAGELVPAPPSSLEPEAPAPDPLVLLARKLIHLEPADLVLALAALSKPPVVTTLEEAPA